MLAQGSTRPDLPWQFIVLDTDGVNAFAAPGGYIHITRGALGADEERGGTGRRARPRDHPRHREAHHPRHPEGQGWCRWARTKRSSGNKALFGKLVDKATDVVMAGFGRGEELESDSKGVVLANKVGYEPHGLPAFLSTLLDRNKNSTQKQGLFASHPEMQERLDKLASIIKTQKLAGTATVVARFKQNVTYTPVPLASVATVAAGPGSAGLTSGETKPAPPPEEPKKKKGFGLGSLTKSNAGSEKESAEVTGSGASRGVDTERSAKGGSNPAPVAVKVTAAEITSFKKDGQLL